VRINYHYSGIYGSINELSVFLNLRPAVSPFHLSPCPLSWPRLQLRRTRKVGIVRDNGITQSQQWPVGFNPSGEVVVWEQDEFWDGVPLD
jgi:hypothetical protein